jgi:hypothetical protein
MPNPGDLTPEQRIAEGLELEDERFAADRVASNLLQEQLAWEDRCEPILGADNNVRAGD